MVPIEAHISLATIWSYERLALMNHILDTALPTLLQSYASLIAVRCCHCLPILSRKIANAYSECKSCLITQHFVEPQHTRQFLCIRCLMTGPPHSSAPQKELKRQVQDRLSALCVLSDSFNQALRTCPVHLSCRTQTRNAACDILKCNLSAFKAVLSFSCRMHVSPGRI